MKKIRGILVVLILVTAMVSSLLISYGSTVQIPKNIEIGLFFNSSAKSTATLLSATGFNIGQYQGDAFTSLFTLTDSTELILRKDSFYINNNGVFVEYTGSTENIPSNLNLQGPYHVQLGGTYSNVDEAKGAMAVLTGLEDTPYLVYENGWRIFVGLYLNEAIAQEKAAAYKLQLNQEAVVIAPSASRVQAINKQGTPVFMFDSQQEVYFEAFSDKGALALITIEGTRFRGGATAKRSTGSDMTIINKLPLEEYLYGVVPREMPTSWHIEALKAQAVAARGFAVTSLNKYKTLGFNLCNTVNSQVYGGYDVESASTNRAVDETKGKLVTYNGQPITPYYHSNSGGQTENSENIWSDALPYLRGVKDEYSLGVSTATWTAVLTGEEIKALLAKEQIDVGDILDIKVTSVSANGRVLNLVVYGTRGEEAMAKERSRRIFGLRSTWFTVAPNSESLVAVRGSEADSITSLNLQGKTVISASGTKKLDNISNIAIYNGKSYKSIVSKPGEFVFDGKGFGHGLGMSQYGAKKMAELNHSYEQILMHYYTGTKVE